MVQRRKRAFTLIAAISITLIGSLLVAASITYSFANRRLNASRTDSEAALMLAEAGINDELNLITLSMQDNDRTKWSTQPGTVNGEPYPGLKGSVTGTTGNFWVVTSSVAAGTTAWTGEQTLYITANAKVNGSWRRVQIGAPNMRQSIFGTFAVFGYNAAPNGNSSDLGFTGANNVLEVIGNVGTNGRCDTGNYTLTYTAGFNFNTLNYPVSSGQSQLTIEPLFNDTKPFRFPTVRQVAKSTFPASYSYTNPMEYVKANSHNTTRPRTWNSGLPGSASMSPTTTSVYPLPVSGGNAYKLFNKNGGQRGLWEGLANAPADSKQEIILPPGDYYFESMDLGSDNNTTLVIDNAGLSVGGNPGKLPVRIWLSGTGTSHDRLSIPVRMTNPDDASTFRLLYDKSNAEFEYRRDSNFPSGTDYEVAGCIYAVTQEWGTTSGLGTKIDFVGGTASNKRIVLRGSLLADRIEFNGYGKIIFPGRPIENSLDPGIGVGFTGGYREF